MSDLPSPEAAEVIEEAPPIEEIVEAVSSSSMIYVVGLLKMIPFCLGLMIALQVPTGHRLDSWLKTNEGVKLEAQNMVTLTPPWCLSTQMLSLANSTPLRGAVRERMGMWLSVLVVGNDTFVVVLIDASTAACNSFEL